MVRLSPKSPMGWLSLSLVLVATGLLLLAASIPQLSSRVVVHEVVVFERAPGPWPQALPSVLGPYHLERGDYGVWIEDYFPGFDDAEMFGVYNMGVGFCVSLNRVSPANISVFPQMAISCLSAPRPERSDCFRPTLPCARSNRSLRIRIMIRSLASRQFGWACSVSIDRAETSLTTSPRVARIASAMTARFG